jgi:hypothetical protein
VLEPKNIVNDEEFIIENESRKDEVLKPFTSNLQINAFLNN